LWCSTHALSDIAPAKKFQTKIVFQQTGGWDKQRVGLARVLAAAPEDKSAIIPIYQTKQNAYWDTVNKG
jgi:ABC-type proline/glycine betaine transport system ATPase subunit